MDNIERLLLEIDQGIYDDVLQDEPQVTPVIEIVDEEYTNPFFVSIDNNVISDMTHDKLKKQYDHVVILCLNNNHNLELISSIIFNEHIDVNDLLKLKQQLTLVSTSISLLKSKQYRSKCIFVQKSDLVTFNHNNIELNTDELVLPLLNLDVRQVNNYLSNDDRSYIQNKYISWFHNSKYDMRKNDEQLISSELTEYWTKSYNCNINMCKIFSNRTITYKPNIINETQTIIKKINNGEIDNNDTNIDHYHLSIINNVPNVMINKLYDMDLSPLTINDFNILYCTCTGEYSIYLFICIILASRDNFHYILNNYDVSVKLMPLIKKYSLITNYLISYCWIASYYEERIKNTKLVTLDRCVYTLKTANLLPFFPYVISDPHLNPYLSILIPKKQLSSSDNLWGLKMLKNYDGYGIADITRFKKNFNMFCTRDHNKNIFEGCDWKNMYISGSCVTACLQKKSPLIIPYSPKQITTEQDYYDAFNKMLNDKYKSSDVDVMIYSQTVLEYIDKIQHVLNIVTSNIKSKTDLTSEKTLYITVHIDFFILQHYTKEYVIKNIHTNELKELIHKVYNDSKFENNKINREKYKNYAYEAHYGQVDISRMNVVLVHDELRINNELLKEQIFKKNDIFETKDDNNPVLLKISEGLKFNITSSNNLMNTIQCFRLRCEEPFSIVSKFHVCNVRAYYSGYNDEVYLTPSFISSMMTYMNLDLKYVTGKQCSIEIINKNVSRGYGLFINNKEKKSITQYFKTDPKWKAILENDKLFGGLQLDSGMLYPGRWSDKNNTVNPMMLHNTDVKYVNTLDDYYEECTTRYGYKKNTEEPIDLLKLRAIGDSGNVNPINLLYILQAWSIIT